MISVSVDVDTFRFPPQTGIGGHGVLLRDEWGDDALPQLRADAVDVPNHLPDIPPVGGEHRRQGPQMEKHVKEYVVAPRHLQPQQVLGDGQVAGAGNGQKFCHALDDAQDIIAASRLKLLGIKGILL